MDTETNSRFVGFHDPVKAPIPRGLNAVQLAALRTLKDKRSFNDLVEDIFVVLVQDDPKFVGYLEATQDSQAQEGSLSADDLEAAAIIRDKAAVGSEVSLSKKAVIAHSMRIVAKRYNFGRKQRKYIVSGEFVPPDNNGNSSNE